MIQEKDCKVILDLIEVFIVTLSTAIAKPAALKVVAKQCC